MLLIFKVILNLLNSFIEASSGFQRSVCLHLAALALSVEQRRSSEVLSMESMDPISGCPQWLFNLDISSV